MEDKVASLEKFVDADKCSVTIFRSDSFHVCPQKTAVLKNKDSVARVIGISIDCTKLKNLIKKCMARTSMQFPNNIIQLAKMAMVFK